MRGVEREMIAERSLNIHWIGIAAAALLLLQPPARAQLFEEFLGGPPPLSTTILDDEVVPANFQPHTSSPGNWRPPCGIGRPDA